NTLVTGIQDIAAVLPLLGTEQCEQHVGSALTGGYLYAATSSISIFGSLGAAKAGMFVLISSFTFRWISGARALRNAKFIPGGTVAPLITIPLGTSQYLAETKLISMLESKHINNPDNLNVEW
ncbi:hypothetical protein GALMADRAFT_16285, partial [Galerina marginata CBS 339.88]